MQEVYNNMRSHETRAHSNKVKMFLRDLDFVFDISKNIGDPLYFLHLRN